MRISVANHMIWSSTMKPQHKFVPLVVSREQVCELLGRSPSWFCGQRRKKLEAAGFPLPLPGMASWSVLAIEEWLMANGRPKPPAEVFADHFTAALHDHRSAAAVHRGML
jgi:hypothetical protein